MPSPVENQGISQHQKTPETLQGEHEGFSGDQVPQRDTPQQEGNNDNNQVPRQLVWSYSQQQGRKRESSSSGHRFPRHYTHQQGNYYYDYVDQQGNYYYRYVDQQGNYYFVPQQLVRRCHHHRPGNFGELFRLYVSNWNTIKQIPHGPFLPATEEATLRATNKYFQAFNTPTPSANSMMIHIGGLAGDMGETCMLHDFYSLIFYGVPQHMWTWIKFHYVHCDPAKNMVFACVTDAWAARLLCIQIHHRFFFDTASETLFYGTTKRCGEEMFQALQINNAAGYGDVAVLVEKDTLRNIVTCEIEDPNSENRNR